MVSLMALVNRVEKAVPRALPGVLATALAGVLAGVLPRPWAATWARALCGAALLVAGAGAQAHPASHTPQAGQAGQAGQAQARAPKAQLASGVAFAPDGRLWLTGLDAQGRLFVQSAPAADLQRWSPPRLLDTAGDQLSADGENRPKLAFGPNGWVVISYTQPLTKPYTGMIRMLRSTDGGQRFSAPFTVHADRQEITHRFESVAFDAQGVLHTLWVDKRDGELAPRVGRKSSYRGAAIYRNSSLDGGASFGPDLKVADHSCECCRIALTPGRDGMLRAMWRHVFEPNVRDHAFVALGATDAIHANAPSAPPAPVRASFDEWAINACPHQGPGLALAADDGFHAVWFGIRAQDGQDVAAVRYGRLRPDGSPVPGSVRLLPDTRAEHADVLAWGDQVALVWRSVDGARSSLKAWLSSDGGQRFRLVELGQVSTDNDHPRLAQQAGRMVAVWRHAKGVQVHDIRF